MKISLRRIEIAALILPLLSCREPVCESLCADLHKCQLRSTFLGSDCVQRCSASTEATLAEVDACYQQSLDSTDFCARCSGLRDCLNTNIGGGDELFARGDELFARIDADIEIFRSVHVDASRAAETTFMCTESAFARTGAMWSPNNARFSVAEADEACMSVGADLLEIGLENDEHEIPIDVDVCQTMLARPRLAARVPWGVYRLYFKTYELGASGSTCRKIYGTTAVLVDEFGISIPSYFPGPSSACEADEAVCLDGLDNDLDGRTDCADVECRALCRGKLEGE